jgi:tetratricopeptide (TPR) repeat protein
VATRIGLLALAPSTPRAIERAADQRGAFMDYTRLVRLQHLMRATRRALAERFPALPHGATVVLHNLPLSSEYAYGGSHALQVWYRDSTLALIPHAAFIEHPDRDVAGFVSYQPDHRPQVVVLEPAAIDAQREGLDRLRAGDWPAALAALARADSLQLDRRALVFRGDLAGRRAYVLAQLGRWDEAGREARTALAAAREDVGARYVVALVHAVRRDPARAHAELDTVLAMRPEHEDALALREALEAISRDAK